MLIGLQGVNTIKGQRKVNRLLVHDPEDVESSDVLDVCKIIMLTQRAQCGELPMASPSSDIADL